MVHRFSWKSKSWALGPLFLALIFAVACSSTPAAPAPAPAPAPAGPTAAEMRALMQEAIAAAAPDTASPEEIRAMVEAAVQGATASQVTGADIQGVVAGAVSKAVTDAVAGQAEPLSAAEVAKIVDAAVMAIPTAAPIVITEVVTEVVTETILAGPEPTPPYWHPDTRFYGNPVYGGQIRINYEDPLDHANLWGAHSGVTVRYRMPVMNSIVADDPYQSGVIIPDLAKDWQGASDLKGITINFEDDIKWHNGDVFTCEDARFTIQTMITGEGITAPEMASKLRNVDLDTTSCTSDSTLQLGFKGPSSTPLLPFLDRAFLIFNKAWFLEGGEDAMFNDVSVGTGPYIWAEGQEVGIDEQDFERNPDYFKPGLPYTDSIKLFGILDEAAQQASMLARLTDWHWVRNFGIPMRVITTHDVTDDAGRLLIGSAGAVARSPHAVEDPAMHRLEPVAHIGQRPAHDHAHGVVEVAAPHLLLDIYREGCWYFLVFLVAHRATSFAPRRVYQVHQTSRF